MMLAVMLNNPPKVHREPPKLLYYSAKLQSLALTGVQAFVL